MLLLTGVPESFVPPWIKISEIGLASKAEKQTGNKHLSNYPAKEVCAQVCFLLIGFGVCCFV